MYAHVHTTTCMFVRFCQSHYRCLQKFWQLAKQVTEFMTWKQVEVSNIFCVLSVAFNAKLLYLWRDLTNEPMLLRRVDSLSTATDSRRELRPLGEHFD